MDREREFNRTWQPALWAKLVALALLLAYVIAFIVANDAQVRVSFVFASATTSVIWVVLLSLAIGVVVGVLLSQLYRRGAGDDAG